MAPCICLARGEPSAEILRVEALSPWRRANLSWAWQTLCGDFACLRAVAVVRSEFCGDCARRSAFAVAPCEFVLSLANPLRRSCVSKLSLWCCASASCSRRTRSALAVAPSDFSVFLACRIASAFAIAPFSGSTCLVRGSSGLKIANLIAKVARKEQTQSSNIAARFRRSGTEFASLSTKVVCEARSGCQIASCSYKSCTRSALPLLRLKIGKF